MLPMVMRLVLGLCAAGCFSGGSLFMKASAGMSRLWPTLAVFGLFAIGIVVNIALVRAGDEVGPAVMIVIGFETLLGFVLAAMLFGEDLSTTRVLAVALVLVGILLLSAESSSGDAPEPASTASLSAER